MDIDISSLELALKTLITEFYPFTDTFPMIYILWKM